jgi:nitrite reductase/ring-hydroxylating ferredoxin subunit
MKKIAFLLIFFLTFSCSNNNIDPNNILPNVPVNETIFLNNPQYINLQVVGGWAVAPGGIKGILIYHSGINNYVAFERACPHLAPQNCSQMHVESSIKMVCPCDDSEFSILNGSPLTEGVKFPARQYRVVLVGPNTLNITNF